MQKDYEKFPGDLLSLTFGYFVLTETQEKAEYFTYSSLLSSCPKQRWAEMWHLDSLGCSTGLLTRSSLVQAGAEHLSFLPEPTLQTGLMGGWGIRHFPVSNFTRDRQKRKSSHFGLNFKGNAFTLPRELVKWLLCYFLSHVSDPMLERVFLISKDIVSTVHTPVTVMIDAIREQRATR